MINYIGISPSWTIAWAITIIFVVIALLSWAGMETHLRIAIAAWNARYKQDVADYEKRAAEGTLHSWDYRPTKSWKPSRSDIEGWFVPIVLSGALAISFIIVQAIWMIPFDAKYWSWYEVSGKVTDIKATVQVDGKYTTENFVVTLDGSDIPFVMDDTRILSQQGKDVTLLCGVGWESYGNAADSWSCSIREADYTR